MTIPHRRTSVLSPMLSPRLGLGRQVLSVKDIHDEVFGARHPVILPHGERQHVNTGLKTDLHVNRYVRGDRDGTHSAVIHSRKESRIHPFSKRSRSCALRIITLNALVGNGDLFDRSIFPSVQAFHSCAASMVRMRTVSIMLLEQSSITTKNNIPESSLD